MTGALQVQIPLSAVLLDTAVAVQSVLSGRSLTETLDALPSVRRPAAQALASHVMRTLGTAIADRSYLVRRRPEQPLLDALLLTALSLLDAAVRHEQGTALPHEPNYASHTLVDQAVEAAAGQVRLKHFKSLINAVLRSFLREYGQLPRDDDEARWNFPQWWVRKLQFAYPDAWQTVLESSATPAPLTLRVNRRRASLAQVADALAAAGVQAEPVGSWGLTLAGSHVVTRLPGYAEGWWSVQDAGAQRAAELLAPREGMRVLDACAAPGGKTAHLLECADVELLALDADAGRLARVHENLARLRLDGPAVQVRAGDAARPDTWWDGRPFDAMLVDAPCTASGVVRRHPDIRWLRREADVQKTAAVQRRMLDALWPLLAPGGRLLYVTCSVFPEECAGQARAFLKAHADAVVLEAPGQLLPVGANATLSHQHDGFFYALFAKQA
ncbi:16S rRNA (cytosine(967)-C(5))-methyltransferase RsmB [Pseudomonas sp. S 311-6]|uniref:16S rRNA (cytosine(967)-C(5))-methyltransferase RsmB n=1 Tax=Kerstersia gyiorum TaxID=206506 RepID=UPI002097E0CF|nr:16S rRNA (cytosine(967)-C(5))-methyltransferase RsmB [Pseudomonas sp. S 311-6]